MKWIERFLLRILDKKKQEVIRLRWQKAELEKTLRELKQD